MPRPLVHVRAKTVFQKPSHEFNLTERRGFLQRGSSRVAIGIHRRLIDDLRRQVNGSMSG